MRYCMTHIQANWTQPAPQNGKAGVNGVVPNGADSLFAKPTTETGYRLIV